MQNGLNDPFIYALEQNEKGYLLVGTGEGLGVFNGISFEMKYTNDGLAENFISEIYKSKNNIIWIGHKDGGISTIENEKISKYNLKSKVQSLITGFSEDDKGQLWLSTQSDGIIKISPSKNTEKHYSKEFADIITNDLLVANKLMYVSSSSGLLVYNLNNGNIELTQTKLQDVNVSKTILKNDSSLIIGTMSEGVYEFNLHSGQLKNLNIQGDIIVKNLVIDGNQNLLISTINEGIIKLDTNGVQSFYNSRNGLESDAVNECFIDREENIWIGSYGNGIFKHSQEIFTYYFTPTDDKPNEVRDIIIENNVKYFAFKNYVISVTNNDFGNADTIFHQPTSSISCMWTDSNEKVWIGTFNEGLFFFNKRNLSISKQSISEDILTNHISAIQGKDDHLWIGTLNGVYDLSISSNEVKKYDISKGLSHNSVNTILLDSNRVYVGCKSSSLSVIENNNITNISFTEDNKVINVYEIVRLTNGRLGIATYGNGIIMYNDTLMENFTSIDGLGSNFCYGIIEDLHQDIWITHNGTLSKFNQEDMSFQTFSEAEGVSFRYLKNSICRDGYDIWYGSEQGVLKFNTFIDNINHVSPLVSLFSIFINGIEHSLTSEITLEPGYYDFKIDIIGLSLKNPSAVLFKHKLEGYDADWSDITKGESIRYSKIPDGTYFLKIVAYNNDMVASRPDVYLKIIIKTPFWKKTWFWILVGAVLSGLIFLLIKHRERRYKLRQIDLERKLVIRTREVTDEKRKVESFNKDITDSINYAKRIQDALLPSVNTFETLFPQSFIVYKPRDIVSGDFFWTAEKDGKLLLGCGDCTGHGVPGAFMSLLGQQTLREIFGIKELRKPHEILKELNSEIKSLMKIENTDEYTPSDGMDIIIGEFDFKNMTLNWSSALRPLVLYRNGERQYFKGSRFSIGSAPSESEYESNLLSLEKGDVLYFFSDGFPDQFGGELGKKLKTSGMFKIMEHAHSLDMKSQKKYIKKELSDWMGSLHQTDDIIIIGIKVP